MLSLWLKSVTLLSSIIVASWGFTIRNNIYPYYQARDLAVNKQRLSTSVTPTSYNLKLYPSINEGYFNGSVSIFFNCQRPTNTIVLHAHEDLNITSVQVTQTAMESEALTINTIYRNVTNDSLAVTLENELQSDVKYRLHIEFFGRMSENTLDGYGYKIRREKIEGFFRGNYIDVQTGRKSWFATINTSPENARRVFPCFDEPSFKTTFQISVARTIDMTTVSVMPLEFTEAAQEDGWVWDHFHTTPLLSTFSINLFISDFQRSEPLTLNTKQSNFSVYFHHQKNSVIIQDQKRILPQLVQYIEDTLGVGYPLSKLDIVSRPNTYYAIKGSAFGLIMLDEYMMHELSTIGTEELVDQWLSHMVTPNWWSGFNVTDILTSYIVSNSYAKTNTKSRSYSIGKDVVYDSISNNFSPPDFGRNSDVYGTIKGEWFLQMLNYTLTEKTLTAGLHNFILNNLYNSYTEDILWSALTNQAWDDGTLEASISVQELVKSWLGNSPRFPVLTVTRNYDSNTASLEQHVFTKPPRNLTKEEQKQLWQIPIMYLTPENMDPSSIRPVAWMADRELDVGNLPGADSFIIMNPIDAGMFLVNYDVQNWGLLSQALKSSDHHIPTETRKKLVQDVMLLTSGEEVKLSIALNTTMFLFNEREYSVWMAFLNWLQKIEHIFQFTSVEDKFYAYIRHLMSPMVKSTTGPPDYGGYNNEQFMFWHHSRKILDKVGYQPYINESYTALNRTIPAFYFTDNDTQLILFCPEFMRTDPGNWSNIENLLRAMQSMSHRFFFEKGIAKCPGYDAMIQRILDGTIDDNTVFSTYEWHSYMQLLTANQKSHNMILTFFMEHFDELKHRYYPLKDMWTVLLQSVTSKIRTKDGLNKLKEFYNENKNKFGYSQSDMEDSIQTVKREMEMRKENIQDLENWFDETLPQFT